MGNRVNSLRETAHNWQVIFSGYRYSEFRQKVANHRGVSRANNGHAVHVEEIQISSTEEPARFRFWRKVSEEAGIRSIIFPNEVNPCSSQQGYLFLT